MAIPLETHRVTLPGGAVFGERCIDEVVLIPPDGFTERWLAEHATVSRAHATTALLAQCISSGTDVSSLDLARRLLVGDRDFLMLELRKITLGSVIQAILSCPSCSQKLDIDIDAAHIEVPARPQRQDAYELILGEHAIQYRLPNGMDQEAVVTFDLDAASQIILNRCLLDDGGVALDAAEASAVIDAMDVRAPQLSIELEITCAYCEDRFVTLFEPATFFLQEMRVQAKQLLREIHALAFYYHWSEREILSLRRDRRRAYLALLHESMAS